MKSREARVLMHPLVADATDNSFTGVIADQLAQQGIEVEPFTWRKAYFAKYDVLHVHWPESFTRHRLPVIAATKSVLFRLLVSALKLRRVRLVATVHNLQSHESLSRIGSSSVQHWYRSADERVYLTRAAASLAPLGPGVYIPHQSYPDLPSIDKPKASASPHLLLFGFLRRYKNIESAIAAAREQPGLEVSIAGRPVPESYGAELLELARGAANVRIELGALPYAVLCSRIAAVPAVFLPYGDLYSSGAALLALSLATPIVVIESPAATELEQEFGRDWVKILPKQWSASQLLAAAIDLSRGAANRTASPDLSERSPASIGYRYLIAYGFVDEGGLFAK